MGCKMDKLIQKSVRLPEDLVEYVNAQKGRDFSKKLINLLTDIREGDAERQRQLQYYDKQICEYRNRLDDLRHKVYDASELLRRLSSPLSYADRMVENNKPEEPGN